MALTTFDDFKVGQIREFGRYHVTKEEVVEFALKYDPQFFHIDEAQAKNGPFGSLVASGWHTCGMCMRMLCDHFFIDSSNCGSPGIDEIRWLRPVRPGDILRLKVETIKVALSRSKPDRGTVWNAITVFNQKDEAVATLKAMTIFLTRAGAKMA
jgi:acyl dehydratase